MVYFKENRPRILINPGFIIYSVSIFIISAALTAAGRNSIVFANWYSTCIYPYFVETIGKFTSLFPFSVGEILFIIFLLYTVGRFFYVAGSLVYFAVKKNIMKAVYRLLYFLRYVIVSAVTIFLVFTLTCGINYNRLPFSHYSCLTITEHSSDELIDLCNYLIDEVNTYAENIETNDEGVFILGDADVTANARTAMESLGVIYPALDGFYPAAKPVLMSEIMSHEFITGIYIPFTLEANYNHGMPAFETPFTICHELSHLKGFMREDEANFIAYLACRESNSAAFNYSGSINALSYVLSAVRKSCGSEVYSQLYAKLCDQAVRDFYYDAEYWNSYKGPLQEIASAVNNSYLIANNQSDGVQSYGRMVDLLIADYFQNIKEN